MTAILHKLNDLLGRLIPVTTPLAVALGFFFPEIFGQFRPFVPWLFGMMTFSGALRLKTSELGNAVKNPLPIFLFFFSSHVLMPAAAFFSSSSVSLTADVITGFVLLFAGPTGVSGFIWVAIFKGDRALGLTLILLDTLLAPLIVPATVYFLRGADIAMDMSGIALSLLLMIVIPTILGVAFNETSRGKIPDIICPYLDPLSKICLIMVIAANTSPVAHNIKFNEPLVWKAALLCIVLTVSGFLLAKLNGIISRSGGEKSVSLIISGGIRNSSAVMTIAVTFFPEMTVLPTLLSVIFQQMITALLGKVIIKRKDN